MQDTNATVTVTASQGGLTRFGDCVLNRDRRELQLKGVSQPLAPRVLDVLVYLIDHRNRVVRKDELIAKVWGGAFVTDSALARAISKARAAIGDTADDPLWIKTIQRVGYRFVGALTEHDAADAGCTAPIDPPASDDASLPMRVALLPFVNQLDDAQFAWVDLGLMSLVQQALARDLRLALTPTAEVLTALGRLAPGLPPAQIASVVQHALNVHCVVSCTVRRVAGGFQLAYEGAGPRAGGLRGKVEGDELTSLGQNVANALESILGAGNIREVPLSSLDPFVNQAVARALQAHALQLNRHAVMYYRIVMELEPANHAICVLTIRALTTVDRDEAVSRGRRLIADVASSDDLRLRAAAHDALGAAIWQLGADDEADFHIKESLRLIEGTEPDDLMARIHAVNAVVSLRAGDLARSERCAQVVETIARQNGAEDRLCWAVNALAFLDLKSGRFSEAGRRVEEAAALARRLKRPVSISSMLGTLAELQWAQGLHEEALATCDELVVELPRCTYPLTTADECFQAALVYASVRRLADLQQLVEIGERIRPSSELRFVATLQGTQALLAGCRGDTATCTRLLQEAADLSARARDVLRLGEFLGLLGVEALRRGDAAGVSAIVDRLTTMPGHATNPIQQQLAAHLHAAVLHATGQAAQARRELLQLCERPPAGRISGMARLDAAWLACEAGDLTGVDALLDDWQLGATSHPLGLATYARYHYALGQCAQACRLQAQCLAFYESPWAPAWLLQLNDAYVAGVPCPVMAGLPSMM